jgi:hypothetical protein
LITGHDLHYETEILQIAPQLIELILEIVKYYPIESYGALEVLSQLFSIEKLKSIFEEKTGEIIDHIFTLLCKRDVAIDPEFVNFASQILTQFLTEANQETAKLEIIKRQSNWEDPNLYVKAASVIILKSLIETVKLEESFINDVLKRCYTAILSEYEPSIVQTSCVECIESLLFSKNIIGEQSFNDLIDVLKKTIQIDGLLGVSTNNVLAHVLKDTNLISEQQLIEFFEILLNLGFLKVTDFKSPYFDASTRTLQIMLSKNQKCCNELIITFASFLKKGFPSEGKLQFLVLTAIAGSKVESSSKLDYVATIFINSLDETSKDMFFDAAIKIVTKVEHNEKHFEKLYPILLNAIAKKRAVPLALLKHCLDSRKCVVAKRNFNHIMDCLIDLLESKTYPIHIRSLLVDTIATLMELDHTKFEMYVKPMNDALSKMTRIIEQEVVPNLFGSMIEFTKLIVKNKYPLNGFIQLIVIWVEITSINSDLDEGLRDILVELCVTVFDTAGAVQVKKLLKLDEFNTIKSFLTKFGDESVNKFWN